MQANEAIEKLREAAQVVVRQALDDVEVHPCDVHNDIVRASGLTEPVRSLYAALAATATIAPPAVNLPDTSQEWAKLDGATAWHLIERHADNWSEIGSMMESWLAARSAVAPVLAAVGVEAQQHSDVIPPSRAEPAGQLDAAGGGWISVDDRLPEDQAHVAVIGPAYGDIAKGRYASMAIFYNGAFYNDDGDDMHQPMHWMPLPPPPAAQSSNPVPRMGGNTSGQTVIREIRATAAQPASDHAKHDGCCNNNCNQGRECPERK